MPPRTNLAQEHFYARLRRWGCQQVTVNQGPATLNLTPFCPTAADLGFEGARTPTYDLRILYQEGDGDGGVAGIVTDDQAELESNYPDRVISANANEIFIPTLWPRVGDALVSPLGNRWVYLDNYDGAAIDCAIVFEIPDLADPQALALPARSRIQMMTEFAHAPVIRLNNDAVEVPNEDSIEITAMVPHLGQIGGAPWVNLLAQWQLYPGGADYGNAILGCVTDQNIPTPADECCYAPEIYDTAIQHQRIVIPQLCPRLNAAATELMDGCRVFLYSFEAVDDVEVDISFEVPSLDWQ
jgi:hypothetical protein